MKPDLLAVRSLIRQCIGSPSGVQNDSAATTCDHRKIAFRSTVTKGARYSRRCTFRKNDLDWHATVQSNWNRHVGERCAALRLNPYDAKPFSVLLFLAPAGRVIDGDQIFRAVWLRKGRGFAGVIVRDYLGVHLSGPRVWQTRGASPKIVREKLTALRVRYVRRRFALAA